MPAFFCRDNFPVPALKLRHFIAAMLMPSPRHQPNPEVSQKLSNFCCEWPNARDSACRITPQKSHQPTHSPHHYIAIFSKTNELRDGTFVANEAGLAIKIARKAAARIVWLRVFADPANSLAIINKPMTSRVEDPEGEEKMKKLMSYLTMGILITVVTALTGLAHGKTRTVQVTVQQDMMIGNTQIEKGNYKMIVNEQTGELEVQSERTGKIVATTKGQIVENNKKSQGTEILLSNHGNTAVMTGLRLEGQKMSLNLEPDNNATGSGQNE